MKLVAPLLCRLGALRAARTFESRPSQNLHGLVEDALVQNAYIANTGDDTYAVWGAAGEPRDVTFRHLVAVNPGVLRPGWYGSCFATYGLRQALFQNVTCRDPTYGAPGSPSALEFPSQWSGRGDTRAANSAFCFCEQRSLPTRIQLAPPRCSRCSRCRACC